MNAYEKQAARYVLLNAWRAYGNRPFRVDVGGRNYKPLRHAERLGWAKWGGPDRCAITAAGVDEIKPYRHDA